MDNLKLILRRYWVISEVAEALINVKRVLSEFTGEQNTLLQIQVTPKVYDTLIIKASEEPSIIANGRIRSSFRPSDIYHTEIAGVKIVPE